MIIIGHRGAAGIEPENTIPSIEAAVKEGVDMIEFDIQVTKDKKLIVFHDTNLLRLTGVNRKVADMTLEEINITSTKSGHPIPTFGEAFEATEDIPVLIDCKKKGWADVLHANLNDYDKKKKIMVTARNTEEMYRFSQLRPNIETYVSELTNPFGAIYESRKYNFTGVSLNFWVLNPLAYFYAKHHKKKFMIFTVNHIFLARFLHLLYPSAAIITNVPHRMARLAKRRREIAKGSASKRQ